MKTLKKFGNEKERAKHKEHMRGRCLESDQESKNIQNELFISIKFRIQRHFC